MTNNEMEGLREEFDTFWESNANIPGHHTSQRWFKSPQFVWDWIQKQITEAREIKKGETKRIWYQKGVAEGRKEILKEVEKQNLYYLDEYDGQEALLRVRDNKTIFAIKYKTKK